MLAMTGKYHLILKRHNKEVKKPRNIDHIKRNKKTDTCLNLYSSKKLICSQPPEAYLAFYGVLLLAGDRRYSIH